MPRWIAHRGGGHWAPENTLAAFRVGQSLGFQGFECDVQLSRDGVPVLIHDATLTRTSSGTGAVRAFSAEELGCLDAGSWHSTAFAGEPIPRLEALLSWARNHDLALNLELKPAPGDDEAVARAVAAALDADDWGTPPRILISSFSATALVAMTDFTGDTWPRAWLVESWSDEHPDRALALGCQGLSAHWSAWTQERVALCHALGLACAAYTVNRADLAQGLFAMGVDSLFTDTLPPED
jgi:glycerophosphoryl diester phosphodiesterase